MCKTVIVTGASSGIGAECAKTLIQSGWNVAVCFNKNEKAAQELCENANKNLHCENSVQSRKNLNDKLGAEKSSTGEAVPFFVDVKSEESVQKLVQDVVKTFGGVSALVNNAGTASFNLLTHTTQKEWNSLFDVHVNGTFLCCKHVLPHMIYKKHGSIVNISSMWGQVGASCEVAYSAAKAAVIGMTKALAKEVGPSGVNVNCIAPGLIATPMTSHLTAEDTNALIEETPLGRIGTAQDVADAVEFLLSKKAAFITGQVIGVNGGFVV